MQIDEAGVVSDFLLELLDFEPAKGTVQRRKKAKRTVAKQLRNLKCMLEESGVSYDTADGIVLRNRDNLLTSMDSYVAEFERNGNGERAFLAMARKIPMLVRVEDAFKATIAEIANLVGSSDVPKILQAADLLASELVKDAVAKLDSIENGPSPAELGRRVNMLYRYLDYLLRDYLESRGA